MFENVKVGDKVWGREYKRFGPPSEEIVEGTVASVTPKKFKVGGVEYWKDTGERYGYRSGMSRWFPTREAYIEVRNKELLSVWHGDAKREIDRWNRDLSHEERIKFLEEKGLPVPELKVIELKTNNDSLEEK